MVTPSPMPLPATQIPLVDAVMGDQYPRLALEVSSNAVFAGNGTVAPSATSGAVGSGWVNVKSAGAKGDGVTDDTLIIQILNQALNALGGGTLYFPKGVYVTQEVLVYSRVNYVGDGKGVSVLLLKPGETSNVMKSFDFDTQYTGTNNAGPFQFNIHDLSVDGNMANCPSMKRGIAIYGAEFQIYNVIVQNCNQDGMYLSYRGNNHPGDSYVILDECFVGFIKIQNCGAVTPTQVPSGMGTFSGGYGLWVNGLHDSTFTSINIGFCGAGVGTASGGFRTEHNGNHFSACHAYGTQQDYAWFLRGQTFLVDCVGEGACTHQFCIAYLKVEITGGTAYFPGTNACSAIGFTSDSGAGSDCNIDGMYIELNNGTHGDFAPAVDFTHMGVRGRIKVKVNQATGNAYSGTPPTDALLEILVGGGAEANTPSLYQRPGDTSLLPPLPQVITDQFTASDATAPDSTKWTRTLGGGTGTSIQVLSNRMKFITGNTGSYSTADDVSMAAVFGSSPVDVEMLFSIYVGDITHESYFYAGARSSDPVPLRAANAYYFTFATSSLGVQNLSLDKRVSSSLTNLWGTHGAFTQLGAGSKMWVRFIVRGSSIQLRHWNDGTSEPAGWDFNGGDTSLTATNEVTFAMAGALAASQNPYHSLDEAYIFAL